MTAATIGALVGSALFLTVGVAPAIAYGGYAGVLLANGIGCGLIPLTAFGMALGVVGVGALFTVVGAMAGTAVGTGLRLLAPAVSHLRR